MARSLVSSQSAVDQQNLTGSSDIGFGQFANARYRGQVFKAGQSVLSSVSFWFSDIGSNDVKVHICNVDQSTKLPTGDITTFIISNAQIVTALTTYNLPSSVTLTPGNFYGFYLEPNSNGSYTDDYHNLKMANSNVYGSSNGIEITNNNGTWSTENLSLIFKTGYPLSRSIASSRTIAGSRTLAS